ncbi:6-O-methylguanine DNA methyltransferase [Leucosporidium creatinivorum]|uniref:Methylated-DNA--protein-cysteine methyltransferase n=1 Tax=Leucosporidium creatinivorum TaxID=106004 RepID=A0A1Y2FXI8_9BASI|nr:6-O-methylguanine DNA methyltransferase [Leucosporidium creatinivorum]
MPALRVTPITAPAQSKAQASKSKPYSRTTTSTTKSKSKSETVSQPALPDSTLTFPTDLIARSRFKLPNGKAVTGHQWKVYDYILSIPVGKVTTYGHISTALSSSPRAVGGALRDNPFAPYIPCHRVIASSLFIGGFQGEWGKEDVTTEKGREESQKLAKKLRVLEEEGVNFDSKGKLIGGLEKVWNGE